MFEKALMRPCTYVRIPLSMVAASLGRYYQWDFSYIFHIYGLNISLRVEFHHVLHVDGNAIQEPSVS